MTEPIAAHAGLLAATPARSRASSRRSWAPVSRPSVKAWMTRSSTPSFGGQLDQRLEVAGRRSARRRRRRARSGARAARRASASRITSFSASEPSSTALSIRSRSCGTIAPAPRLRWPTSELPIWPGRQPDGLAAGGQRRVVVLLPQPVEHGRVGQRDRVPRTVRRQPPAVEDDEADAGDGAHGVATSARAISTICANESGSRLAPPTSAPSTSGSASSSSAFSGLSEPP